MPITGGFSAGPSGLIQGGTGGTLLGDDQSNLLNAVLQRISLGDPHYGSIEAARLPIPQQTLMTAAQRAAVSAPGPGDVGASNVGGTTIGNMLAKVPQVSQVAPPVAPQTPPPLMASQVLGGPAVKPIPPAPAPSPAAPAQAAPTPVSQPTLAAGPAPSGPRPTPAASAPAPMPAPRSAPSPSAIASVPAPTPAPAPAPAPKPYDRLMSAIQTGGWGTLGPAQQAGLIGSSGQPFGSEQALWNFLPSSSRNPNVAMSLFPNDWQNFFSGSSVIGNMMNQLQGGFAPTGFGASDAPNTTGMIGGFGVTGQGPAGGYVGQSGNVNASFGGGGFGGGGPGMTGRGDFTSGGYGRADTGSGYGSYGGGGTYY